MKKSVLGILVTLLLVGMLTLAFNIQPVKASGTIYIRADGSIEPSTAPISSVDNVTYTLTGDILSDADGIVVEKSNTIIDGNGYTLQGLRIGNGFYLSGISNVTIKSTNIEGFECGVLIAEHSSYNVVSGNNIIANYYGIQLKSSSNNSITENNITNNYDAGGINLDSSSSNSITENNIATNYHDGIRLKSSNRNIISGNDIADNVWGIILSESSNNNIISGNDITRNFPQHGLLLTSSSNNNTIYHNNLIDNTIQATDESYNNTWDDGYPSCGNYWSDYTGVDVKSGPSQDQPGSDGIGDTHYVIGVDNVDHYPLMNPWIPPDIAVTGLTAFIRIADFVIFRNIFPTPPPSYSIYINVTVQNQGNKVESFNLTTYASSIPIQSQHITLLDNNTKTITFRWDTAGWAKANYTLSAHAFPVSDETDTSDNTLINGWIVVTIPGDVDGDGDIDIYDVVRICAHYGHELGEPDYDANCDVDGDGDVDIYDIVIMCNHYGETYP